MCLSLDNIKNIKHSVALTPKSTMNKLLNFRYGILS